MLGATTTVTILRASHGADDAFGRRTMTWAPAGSVPANLFQRTAREFVDGKWVVVSVWKCLVPPGTTVDHGDRIEDADGRVFEVESVVDRRTPFGIRHRSLGLRTTEASVL